MYQVLSRVFKHERWQQILFVVALVAANISIVECASTKSVGHFVKECSSGFQIFCSEDLLFKTCKDLVNYYGYILASHLH
jgi:hypothetical protein